MVGRTDPDVALDDDALVVAAQEDRRAFAPLYERYVTPVYRYCLYRLDSREAAEDATSLIFTRALGALPRYQPGRGSFRSWLFVIAHNVVADIARRARPAVPLPDMPAADGHSSLEAAVIAEQELGELRRLLRELPAEQQRVMELRLSGLSSPEVAAILGRSATAVRSLQFRAVATLRMRLGSEAQAKEKTHAGH